MKKIIEKHGRIRLVLVILTLMILTIIALSPMLQASMIWIFSTAGDGYVEYTDASWNTAHDATSAEVVDYTMAAGGIRSVASVFSGAYTIHRGFMTFDTSVLPDDSGIANSTLYIDDNSLATEMPIGVVQGFQASSNELQATDYNDCGDAVDNPTEGADRKVPNAGYTAWTLNSTGRGWIETATTTKLCIRAGEDIDDTPATTFNWAYFNASESGAQINDPYLEINYKPRVSRIRTYEIAASADDTYAEYQLLGPCTNQVTATNLEVANPSNHYEKAFLRFNINIPDNSTIEDAYLRLYSTSANTGKTNFTIRLLTGDGSWDDDGFTIGNYGTCTALNNISTSATTVASNDWNGWGNNTWNETTDISSQVQEFINADGYDDTGDWIGFKIDKDIGATVHQFEAQDAAGTNEAELVILYTAPDDSDTNEFSLKGGGTLKMKSGTFKLKNF